MINESIEKRVKRFLSRQRKVLELQRVKDPSNTAEPWELAWKLATTSACEMCGSKFGTAKASLRHERMPTCEADCRIDNIRAVCPQCANLQDNTTATHDPVISENIDSPRIVVPPPFKRLSDTHYDLLVQGWHYYNDVSRNPRELPCGNCGRMTAWKIDVPKPLAGQLRRSCCPQCTDTIQRFNADVDSVHSGKALRFIWRTRRRLAAMGINWLGPRSLIEDLAALCHMLAHTTFCTYCQRNITAMPGREITFDHVIPLRQAGIEATPPSNIVVCCAACNLEKD